MKKAALLICAMTTCAVIAGCAYDGHSGGYAAVGVGGYDGYYDNFYGEFYDGYWGGDGHFWYRDHPTHEFRRDEGGHFQRAASQGFHGFHGHINTEHHEH